MSDSFFTVIGRLYQSQYSRSAALQFIEFEIGYLEEERKKENMDD